MSKIFIISGCTNDPDEFCACAKQRHYVFRLFVRPFVCYQTCEHDILKRINRFLMSISTSGLLGRVMKRRTLGSGGQRSRLHKAEDRFGGPAEAAFSTPLCRDFVVNNAFICKCTGADPGFRRGWFVSPPFPSLLSLPSLSLPSLPFPFLPALPSFRSRPR